MLGRYAFILPDSVAHGWLKPVDALCNTMNIPDRQPS